MRKTHAVVAVLAVVLVVGAVGAQQAEPEKGEVCPEIRVSAVGGDRGQTEGKFSARRVEDLNLTIVYGSPLKEEHVVSVLVYTPRGHLYRRMDVPVAPAGMERGGTTRRLPGYPYPVEVRRPEQERAGEYAIDVRFPVAGTTIVTSSLYGWWRVEALIDGEAVRCIAAPKFYIGE